VCHCKNVRVVYVMISVSVCIFGFSILYVTAVAIF